MIMKTLRYFYHPDHLGSSSWITDGSGNAIQHLHYLPFGEDWVDQRNGSWSAPYTFSGKEKDVETGYSYFGARYYDSGLSIWLSVDPMSDNTPFATPYAYCINNPIILHDPDGRDWYEVENPETKQMEIKWTEHKSQKEMDAAKVKGNYLGEAVVVMNGSKDEKLGKGGNLSADKGANPALVTIYGKNGKNDIKMYEGLTVSSDPSEYSMVASGDYKMYYEDMGGPYGGVNLSYRVTTLSGSTEIPTEGGEINKKYKKQGAFMYGIYFHKTNNDGWAGVKGNVAVSSGCPVVNARNSNWKSVEKQLGKSSNIYLRITR